MSNPAIVMMTDPSRCSLGDVHYLVQALLEMQQMGEHAAPQAFCDHPAAAKDFIAAYAHAYPQLVLEDREIPTPDHLHSLITTGQVGGLARPFDAAAPDSAGFASQGLGGALRPAEQNGLGAFPIVVLTLGSSQALADALQQNTGMRDSIRLIDIVPEGAEKAPLSIADAAAIGDRLFEDEGAEGVRAELDEMSAASTTDSATLTLQEDQLNLNIVEPDDTSGSPLPVDEQEEEQGAAPVQPASTVAQPEPAAVVVQPIEPTLSDESYGASAASEPTIETTSQAPAWPGGAAPVVPVEQPPTEELVVQDPGAANGEDGQAGEDPQDGEPQKGADGNGSADPPDADEPEPDEEKAKAGVLEPGDDLVYPPVGMLTAEADVHYPAFEQVQGALHELAAVMLEDGMIDANRMDELTADLPDEIESQAAREGGAKGSQLVAIEDLQDTFDQDSDDPLDEATIAWPQHDSDL